MTRFTDWATFLGSWAKELGAKQDRVRSIIGDAHWGEDGAYKESIFRSALRDLLPDRLGVSTGFIYFVDESVSRQMDVMIWDRASASALVEDGEFAIVPQDAVEAIVEIKTTLDKREYCRALEVLHPSQLNYWINPDLRPQRVRDPYPPPKTPLRCVFAYDLKATVKTLFRATADFYRERYGADAYMMFCSPQNLIDLVIALDRLVIERDRATWVACESPTLPAFEHFAVRLRSLLDERRGSNSPGIWAMNGRLTLEASRCQIFRPFVTDEPAQLPYNIRADRVDLWVPNPPLFDPVEDNPWDEDRQRRPGFSWKEGSSA